jgi:hypothetical protein
MGLTEPLDRECLDALVQSGDNTLVATSADFTPLDVGRTITVSRDTDTFTTTIASITNDGEVEMAAPCTFSTSVQSPGSLYIVAGGDHGLLVDAVHISYVSGSAFGPFLTTSTGSRTGAKTR